MKWVWPFSWYFRIRELERQLAMEQAMNRELEMSLRAANFQNTIMTSAYSNAMMSLVQSTIKRP